MKEDQVCLLEENRSVAPLLWLKQTCLDGLEIASAYSRGQNREGDEDARRQGQGDEARYQDHEGDKDSRRQGQGDEAQYQDHECDEDSRRQGEHEGEEAPRSQGGRVAENTDQAR